LGRVTADPVLVVGLEDRHHALLVEVGSDQPCLPVRNTPKRTYRIRLRPLWPDYKVEEKAAQRPV
jgi:hypothetical protein